MHARLHPPGDTEGTRNNESHWSRSGLRLEIIDNNFTKINDHEYPQNLAIHLCINLPMKKLLKGVVLLRHCNAEFIKHVFPRLGSPHIPWGGTTFWGDATSNLHVHAKNVIISFSHEIVANRVNYLSSFAKGYAAFGKYIEVCKCPLIDFSLLFHIIIIKT